MNDCIMVNTKPRTQCELRILSLLWTSVCGVEFPWWTSKGCWWGRVTWALATVNQLEVLMAAVPLLLPIDVILPVLLFCFLDHETSIRKVGH